MISTVPMLLMTANALSPLTVSAPATAARVLPAIVAPAVVQRAAADAGPHVVVPSIIIRVKRFTRYNPPGRKEPAYGTYSWVPDFEFFVRGPLESGSQIMVNFQKPGGGAWLSVPCETPEIAAADTNKISCPGFEEQQAIVPVGEMPFQIIVKNALTGTKTVLFSGKANVKRYKYKYDKSPGAYEFYVDQDWQLPMGFLGVDTTNEDTPMLEARMWVKNVEDNVNTMAVYLLYNGKPIASSKHTDSGIPDQISVSHDREVTTAGETAGDPDWRRLRFLFTSLRFKDDPNARGE
jgi:hypothetical protein